MAFTWHGAARAEAVVNLGPLALIQPLLEQLDIAGIIGGTFGCRRLDLAAAARHTRSELFEDVAFDGPGGQRLRRRLRG
jgi:hypothetical protein